MCVCCVLCVAVQIVYRSKAIIAQCYSNRGSDKGGDSDRCAKHTYSSVQCSTVQYSTVQYSAINEDRM